MQTRPSTSPSSEAHAIPALHTPQATRCLHATHAHVLLRPAGVPLSAAAALRLLIAWPHQHHSSSGVPSAAAGPAGSSLFSTPAWYGCHLVATAASPWTLSTHCQAAGGAATHGGAPTSLVVVCSAVLRHGGPYCMLLGVRCLTSLAQPALAPPCAGHIPCAM
jgi:hypothetical protein